VGALRGSKQKATQDRRYLDAVPLLRRIAAIYVKMPRASALIASKKSNGRKHQLPPIVISIIQVANPQQLQEWP
jgi:hypothetical protein